MQDYKKMSIRDEYKRGLRESRQLRVEICVGNCFSKIMTREQKDDDGCGTRGQLKINR